MPTALDKPVDLGNGSLCASFGASGAWLSLGAPHPTHGFVELNGLPPFDEAWRGDPTATRRYRSWMVEERYAFLRLEVDGAGPMPAMAVDLGDPIRPRWRGRVGSVAIEGHGWTDAKSGTVGQRWQFQRRDSNRPIRVRLRTTGRLDRPALAEITEVNPPAPLSVETQLTADEGLLVVSAPALSARLAVVVGGVAAKSWQIEAGGASLSLSVSPEDQLDIGCVLAPSSSPGRGPQSLPIVDDAALRTPSPRDPATSSLVERAIAYVRGCTALAVAPGVRAILTDHRILPLSWTRDAYYQALLLLATGQREDLTRVADHLRWLWTRCERPDGRWVRSHYADGRRKDLAFQADQQLYPLVELADFWRVTGSLPEGVDWARAVPVAWRASLAEIDPSTGLIASAETAADDPATAPFIAPAQILLWYAASRLAELADAGAVALDAGELRGLAAEVRSSVDRRLVMDGPFGRQWAYAADDADSPMRYHDANDLPTALAPAWGFCSADDPVWRATMRYAFSSHNPGFFAGDCAGLGSLHTPGPWTLGDVQAWLVARLTDDRPSADAALARLRSVAFADGMLPEAYAADEPRRRIRHWFAWPGALLGALLLLEERGELIDRLRA